MWLLVFACLFSLSTAQFKCNPTYGYPYTQVEGIAPALPCNRQQELVTARARIASATKDVKIKGGRLFMRFFKRVGNIEDVLMTKQYYQDEQNKRFLLAGHNDYSKFLKDEQTLFNANVARGLSMAQNAARPDFKVWSNVYNSTVFLDLESTAYSPTGLYGNASGINGPSFKFNFLSPFLGKLSSSDTVSGYFVNPKGALEVWLERLNSKPGDPMVLWV